jgi:FtsP/CotA-like multicopper oxidase with cupredoxin domain
MTHTRFIRVLALAGVLAGALSLPPDQPSKPDAKDAEIAALKAKVQEQAQEIRHLKAELDAARRLPLGNLKIVPSIPAPQLPAQPGDRVPPDWQAREFNGTTFYIVPLSFDAPARNAPRPPARPFAVQGTLLPKPVTPVKK